MKKIIALVLALLMLLCFAGCRNQVTHYTDKENFEMTLYPDGKDGKVFASGLNAIQIVMNTPNVESGNGEVAIYRKSDDHLMVKYDVRLDDDKIFMNSSKNPAHAQIIMFLPEGESFESGESYYVTAGEEAFYIDDIKGFSGAIEKGDWEFTIADYGFDGNISEFPNVYLVGDNISVPIKLSGDAARAVLMYDNVSVLDADVRELSSTGKFEIKTVNAGTASISIMFLTEDGRYIETLAFNVTVK